MRALEWMFIAGAAAGAAYLLLGRKGSGKPIPLPEVRIGPLPELPDGRKPVISSAHKSENPSRPSHEGVDLMYPRLPGDTQEIGDGAGARRFIMPLDAPVVATESGVVQIAGVAVSSCLHARNAALGRKGSADAKGTSLWTVSASTAMAHRDRHHRSKRAHEAL